jgi:hypothetical protein
MILAEPFHFSSLPESFHQGHIWPIGGWGEGRVICDLEGVCMDPFIVC